MAQRSVCDLHVIFIQQNTNEMNEKVGRKEITSVGQLDDGR